MSDKLNLERSSQLYNARSWKDVQQEIMQLPDSGPMADLLADRYIAIRKQELAPCGFDSINKTESVGQRFSGFFTDEHIIYPGHNNVGVKLNDDRLYHFLLRVVRLMAQNGIVEDNEAASIAIQYTLNDYRHVKNLNRFGMPIYGDGTADIEAIEAASEARRNLFYDENRSGIVDLADIRMGIVCTEKAALAHNSLLFLGLPSEYCIGGHTRKRNKKILHSSDKHSFVITEFTPDNPVVFDPANPGHVNAEEVFKRVRPMVAPIKLTNDGRITAIGKCGRTTVSNNTQNPDTVSYEI